VSEKRVMWERPVTPLPGEEPPVKGAVSACRYAIRHVPKDGTWFKVTQPFSSKTSNANQAKRKLGLEYPSFEFRVRTEGHLRFMMIRFRADEVTS